MKKFLLLALLCSLSQFSLARGVMCLSFLNEVSRSDAEIKRMVVDMFYAGGTRTQAEVAQALGIPRALVAYYEAIGIQETGLLQIMVGRLVHNPKDITRGIPRYAAERQAGRIQTQEYDLRLQMVAAAMRKNGEVLPLINLTFQTARYTRLHWPSESGLAWASHYIKNNKKTTGYIHVYRVVSKYTFRFWQSANLLPDRVFHPDKDLLLRFQRAADFEALGIQGRLDEMPPPRATWDKYEALNRALEVERAAIADLGITYERLKESEYDIPRPDVEVDVTKLPEPVADYVTERAQWILKQQDALFGSGVIPRKNP